VIFEAIAYIHIMEKLFTPVFAGGTGRSGTTIIVNLLSRHPEFHSSMPREIKYLTERNGLIDFNFNRPIKEERSFNEMRNAIAARILPYLGKSKLQIFSDRLHGRWWSEEGKKGRPRGLVQGIELSVLEAIIVFEVEYKKNLRNASRNFYFTLSSSQIMKPEIKFFADSTPTNIINAKYLHQLLPQALFINMIRDGRDVALSVSKERWGPSTPEKSLNWWEKRIEMGFQSLRTVPNENKIDIRLEDLVVTNRDSNYSRLLSFLKVEDSPKLREYFDSQLIPEKTHGGEWKNQVKNPETFDRAYSKTLQRLAKKGIHIEKYY